MACLDTTLLIDLTRSGRDRRALALAKLGELLARGEKLATTRFNVAELYVGVHRSTLPDVEQRAVDAVLDGLIILDFTHACAILFGQMTARLQRIGRPVGDMDVLIAATALAWAHPVIVTRNPDHFADLPGLTVESH